MPKHWISNSYPLHVLIVDDCPDTRSSLGILLRLWGHEVREAGDGLAALAEAETYHPDVVLLDVGLPRLNGYEVARRLRQLPGMEQAYLVAVTGYGREQDRAEAFQAGFDLHLLKPFALDKLECLLADRSANLHHG